MASILGQRRLAFDAGRWRVVLLDSTDLPDGKGGGSLSTCEMKRLEAELTNHGDRLFLIVLHHQPMPVGSDWQDEIGLGNASAFWQMLERYPQQKCLLFGHLHQEWQLNQGQNRLLGCPSTAVQFRKGCAAFELETQGIEAHPGYRWLQLFDSGQVITGIERLALA
jgi:Icc protein